MSRRALGVSRPRPQERRSRARARGAALVEFVIAFVPMLTMFFAFAQAAQLAKAKLVTKHAAVAATRAAIVILDHDHNPGNNGPESDIQAAMALAMGTYADDRNLVAPSADCQKPDKSDPFGLVTCTVTVTYNCDVPIGKFVVCGGSTMELVERMSLPHQGARYK